MSYNQKYWREPKEYKSRAMYMPPSKRTKEKYRLNNKKHTKARIVESMYSKYSKTNWLAKSK